jgi:vesicle-fusing ATPase
LPELSKLTENFTGAEIEGLVRNAASYAIARITDLKDIKAADEKALLVEWSDFERSLKESPPAFGNKDFKALASLYRNGICNYGLSFEFIWSTLTQLLSQIKSSSRTPLISVLLQGEIGCGKTAIAAKFSAESEFPYIRIISPDSYIGLSESDKCAKLLKVFNDAYLSAFSLIFIDDIERIIDYTPVGPRFSNSLLQV